MGNTSSPPMVYLLLRSRRTSSEHWRPSGRSTYRCTRNCIRAGYLTEQEYFAWLKQGAKGITRWGDSDPQRISLRLFLPMTQWYLTRALNHGNALEKQSCALVCYSSSGCRFPSDCQAQFTPLA